LTPDLLPLFPTDSEQNNRKIVLQLEKCLKCLEFEVPKVLAIQGVLFKYSRHSRHLNISNNLKFVKCPY